MTSLTPEDRAAMVDLRDGAKMSKLRERTKRVVQDRGFTNARKYIRLTAIADSAKALVDRVTPCRRGCAHCCYIAVPIALSEAETLSKASGRTIDVSAAYPPMIRAPEAASDHLNEALKKFSGQPCPFLGAENECTVYESRPVVCRTHQVIESDSSKCDVSLGPIPVAQYDLSWIDEAVALVTMEEPYADIREFFPKEKP